MTFMQLALLGYGAVLALVPVTLAGAVLLRRVRGDRWEVPLEWSPELEGILSRPPGMPAAPADTAAEEREPRTDVGPAPVPT